MDNTIIMGTITPLRNIVDYSNADNYITTFEHSQQGKIMCQKKITIARLLTITAFDALMVAVNDRVIDLKQTVVTVTVVSDGTQGQDVTVSVVGPHSSQQKTTIGHIVSVAIAMAVSQFGSVNKEV